MKQTTNHQTEEGGMSEQDIQLGDTVRLTYEGTVTNATPSSFGLNDGSFFNRATPHGSRRVVEILEKRPPQVGDVIASRKGLKKLPELTVVVGSGTPPQRPMIVTRNGTIAVSDGTGDPWVTEKFHKINGTSAPYTVIYVPSV